MSSVARVPPSPAEYVAFSSSARPNAGGYYDRSRTTATVDVNGRARPTRPSVRRRIRPSVELRSKNVL